MPVAHILPIFTLLRNTSNNDVKLSDEQKNSLEGNLSFKECGESLKLMKNGKSPGFPVQIEFLTVLKYDYLFH
jgi:hypothetical protein